MDKRLTGSILALLLAGTVACGTHNAGAGKAAIEQAAPGDTYITADHSNGVGAATPNGAGSGTVGAPVDASGIALTP